MAEFRSNNVEEYFMGKTILVTGVTGFLAKIFVEKILRVQPNIKRLYLLVRASNPHVAIQRLHNEVFGKELFKIQRDKWGENFSSFLSEKVVAVAGDVSLHNFGIKDQILIENMLQDIEIIVHSAATTRFDERANLYGWQDTYALTKAMGEMIVTNMKGNIPLIITRPPTILGTHSDPFPGWIEGVRTIDFVFVEYFKGAITSFVGDPNITVDGIPADMVTNSTIIALVVHSKNHTSNNLLIYHIGTSLRNPIKMSDVQDIMHLYVTKNPWLKNYGKSGASIKKFTFNPNYTEDHEFPQHKRSRLKRIIEIYRPYYTEPESIFDDKNAEKLRMAIKGVDDVNREFNFDPKRFDWKDYLMNGNKNVFGLKNSGQWALKRSLFSTKRRLLHCRLYQRGAFTFGVLVPPWHIGGKNAAQEKLGANWEGPYQVIEVLGKGAYKLRMVEGAQVPKT
ncbi:hypothetical protein PIB30_016039 [Stylosanthes scabra]|uniref:Fatty acyl-CoA reductase n=1 Tax=Stylosanthes scabra TaxID=79078 RepID=A0ABU6Y5Q2_9FABA|nr:hypothetical protein [Stylosanthes scabra]